MHVLAASEDDRNIEAPSRPFEQWLDHYITSTAMVGTLDELGDKCRDARART
jgi:hypothetical protein